MIGRCLGHNGRAEFYIRHADDESLGLLRCQVIDRTHHFLAIFRSNLHHREVLFFSGLFSKLPFILEPGFFGLFHHKSDFYGFSMDDRLPGQEEGAN